MTSGMEREIAYTSFGGLLFGGINGKKWGDHQKEKFFINNSVKDLILFKEEGSGGGGELWGEWSGWFQCGGKWGLSPKEGIFLEEEK